MCPEFCTTELWRNKVIPFEVAKFVAICYATMEIEDKAYSKKKIYICKAPWKADTHPLELCEWQNDAKDQFHDGSFGCGDHIDLCCRLISSLTVLGIPLLVNYHLLLSSNLNIQ